MSISQEYVYLWRKMKNVIFMNFLNQKGRKLKIVFFIFSIGAIFNILWVGYSTFSDKILTYLGFDSVKVRDFTGTYGYLIIIPGLIFTLGYYMFTRKKIYGFEWIIIFSIILLIVVPIYVAATNSWGVRYH